MNENNDIYLELSLPLLPRLLALMDRDFLSPTCGSFDRAYWHHKTKDFSSAASQQGILSLSIVWKYKLVENPYYQNDYILKLIKMAFNFTEQIQNADGSFDEWYWNERGWAGPTGYVLHAICQTFLIMSEQLTQSEVIRFKKLIKRSAFFLMNSWEKDVLANHIAMSLLAIAEANSILKLDEMNLGFNKLLLKFDNYFNHEEGWSLEYDGADVGYQTGTLSFLSRILKITQNAKIENYCLKSMEFIQYFCAPGHRFISIVGSRQTSNCFHFGFEYFGNTEIGSSLAHFFKKSLSHNNCLKPSDQEDHYLIYRIPEFLESYLEAVKNVTTLKTHFILPFQNNNFVKEFSSAGIVVKKTSKHFMAFSYLRGGAFELYENESGKKILSDSGISIKNTNGKVWSNLWIDKANIFQISEKEWKISARLKKVNYSYFNPLKFILFRMASFCLAFNKTGAYYFKALIRKMLMTNLTRSRSNFSRIIKFDEDTISIEDQININVSENVAEVIRGGIFFTRVIPQTKYFYVSDVNHFATKVDQSLVEQLNSKRSLLFKRVF